VLSAARSTLAPAPLKGLLLRRNPARHAGSPGTGPAL